MGLESTMLCLDNSEWMRNGDYAPDRMGAQHDAANVLCSAKTNSNPESTVGILSMAGQRVEVLVSPTDDMSKILNALHEIPIGGKCKLINAIQVAQLALKHRREKKGSQRIVVFVASPVVDDDKSLTKAGKLLKKNNIAADVISFGNLEGNDAKLQLFIDSANSNDNSRLVSVAEGMLPADVLVTSPILNDGEGGAYQGGGGGGGGFSEFGGIDPNMDPELALALRVSMEEERARQEAAGKVAESNATSASTNAVTPAVSDLEEDDALQQALKMSVQEADQTESSESKEAPPPAPSGASAAAFMDPNFVNSLLNGIPGVDPNDPKIKQAMEEISKNADKKDNDKKEEDKK